MIDTWKKRREDEEEYIPGAQAMAEQRRPASPAAAYRAPKTTQQRYADIDSRIADYTYQKFVESDDYASLVKRYSKQGLRAMDDTLGRVAARTGGIASSYATTAGQQAYGGYMTELEGIARDMYERDKAEMMDERERLYDMQRQERSDALDLYKLRIAADEDKYNRSRAEEQEDYDRKLFLAEKLAGSGDFSLYEELGLNKDQVGNMKAAYDKANAPVEVEQKPKLTAAQAKEALDEGITTPEVIAAYEYYYGAGALGNGAGGSGGTGGTGDEIKEQQQTDYDQAVYEAVYETIKKADPKRGQNIAKLITTPEDWAADKQGYRTYSDYLTAELKKIGLDVSPIIKNLGAPQVQTGGTTGSTASAKYNEAKSFVDEIASRYGVDQVMEDFAEKPDELTEEEFRALWAYITSLQ